MSTETAPKKPRRTRRNFEQIVKKAIVNCRAKGVAFNSLATLDVSEAVKAGIIARAEVYTEIAQLLEGEQS